MHAQIHLSSELTNSIQAVGSTLLHLKDHNPLIPDRKRIFCSVYQQDIILGRSHMFLFSFPSDQTCMY